MHTDPLYADLVVTLRSAGCVFAEDEARLLLDAGGDVEALVARRVAGEPLEWILGWADFGGLRVSISPGVFIPRQRTVFLADLTAARLPKSGTVVELCCGSGAVTARIVAADSGAVCYAADIDPVAVAVARTNLPDSTVVVGDLFASLPQHLRGQVDVIVANTPYVPTDEIRLLPPEAREHEPAHTLDGGPDGLVLLRRISAEAPDWLRPGGHLLIEISPGQWNGARAAFEAAGLDAACSIDEDQTFVAIGTLPPGVGSEP